MAQVGLGDSNPVSTARLSQKAVSPLDGQIWVITDNDYDNKVVYDDGADLEGMAGKTIIFGKGVFSGFRCTGCDLYGQGGFNTIILDDLLETIGEGGIGDLVEGDIVSYAAKISLASVIEGITFQNAGVDETATLSCGLVIVPDAGSTMLRHCGMDSQLGGGADAVDLVVFGTAGNLFMQQCTCHSFGGKSLRNVGGGLAVIQSSIMLGSSTKDTGAGDVIHNTTTTIVTTHANKGYFIAHTGVMYYMDGTNPATSVNDLLDQVIALP